MKFIYFFILFAMSLIVNLQAQHQQIIPVTACQTVNIEHIQTIQSIDHKANNKRRFTQKTSITKHSKIKKTCLYTGLACGIVGGFLLMGLTWPIIASTFKVIVYTSHAICCLIMTGRLS